MTDNDCQGDLRCRDIPGARRCVNPSCPTEDDCVCDENCWDLCSYTTECPQNYVCQETDGGPWRCVNPDCNKEQDCNCIVLPQVLGAKTPPVLPKAGFSGGILIIIGVVGVILRVLPLLI